MKIIYSYIAEKKDGASIHIENFVREFRILGNAVVECPAPSIYNPSKRERQILLRRFRSSALWILRNILIFWKVLKISMEEKPDLLIFRYPKNNHFLLCIFILAYFWPIVLEINAPRSFEGEGKNKTISFFLDRISIRCCHKAFVVSEVLKVFLESKLSIPPDKLFVIPNGVDTSKFNPNIEGRRVKESLCLNDKFIVGFIGSFKPWHGTENIVPLAEIVCNKNQDIVFLVIGEGEGQERIQRIAREKGLSEKIYFTGYISHEEVPSYIAAMDVTISPHVYKEGPFHGSPLKLFEYMSMGKPLIASPLGQIKDLIKDGISGRLIPTDDMEYWAAEIEKMYLDQRYRKFLGQNARKAILRGYSWANNAEKVQSACQLAVSKKGFKS